MLVHQPLDRCNLDQLSGNLLEGIKSAVGLSRFEAMCCNECLGEHHHRHVVMEPAPRSSLELVGTQHLLDIAVVLFDCPPKVCPLDEFVE